MNALLAQFVAEGRELLQEAGEDLLALERTPGDVTAINRLFRSVHTLKGSSGLFDVQPLTRILHAAEDMFQAVREHGLALTPEMVDQVLKVLDQTGRWIDSLDRHEVLPDDAEPIARTLSAETRARFAAPGGKDAAQPEATVRRPPATQLPDDITCFSEAALRAAAETGRTIFLVSYLPEDSCFFKGEDPLYLALQIPQLEAFGVAAVVPWQPLAGLDPFNCNLAFHALSSAAGADIDALFRYVPEQVTVTELAASALAPPPPPELGSAEGRVGAALLRAQVALLELPAPDEEFAGRVASAARVSGNVLRFFGRHAAVSTIAAAGAETLATRRIEPLRDTIADLLAETASAASIDFSADVEPAADAKKPAAVPVAAAAEERIVPRTLRVDQEKIDALMNLVAELVVAKNSLPFLARRAEQHYGLRELGREIKDQYGVIDRIAQELQGAIMAVRMMPIGQVFQRFPRLVRDLSRKLGKQVDLVIAGEETEADKNVIENLFDPLMHMVRNSLDHGIETPEERVACGKPGTATVQLLARHDSDQVVIEIVDDGRGIDPEMIKRKAYERGLLDEDRLATIGDDEARMLVFAAGFSTAETISDVSGRGVGMDVVRNAVEKAGGRIALTSEKGRGTTLRLNLPLSMAVSRVMTVLLDERVFGIPMDLIHEIVRVPKRDVMRIKSSQAFVLRDRVVPLLHLSRLLGLPDTADADEVAVLVVRVAGQTIGLGISAFGEGMEVILKPLEGMLAKIEGYAGTALLGDGRVLLVLDLKELMQ